jgi:hypothetical protein
MLWKKDDLVSHYSSINKIGKVIDIIYEKPTTWFVGGTPDVRTFLLVEYSNGERTTINTGDAVKVYK